MIRWAFGPRGFKSHPRRHLIENVKSGLKVAKGFLYLQDLSETKEGCFGYCEA